MRKTILLMALILLCLPFLAFAQGNGPITIHGKVLDAELNELIGASILEEGTTNGTVTDIDGKFTITVSSMEAKLKAAYCSYQDQTIKVSNDSNDMVFILNEVEGYKPRKERENIELTDDDRGVVHGINSFSFKLLNVLDKQKSIVTSPLSIACLLSMTNNGAAGKTRMEISKMLDCTPEMANSFYRKMIPFLTDSQYGSKFNMANALFVDPHFHLKGDFQREADESYEAFVRQGIDVEEVNDWCARQTNGMIPSMMDSQPMGASLIGLNAVYFESLWERDFDVEDTENDYFTNEDGKKKKMPIMHQERAFPYAKGKNFSVMSMPYKGEVKYAITFLLPDKGYKLHQVLGLLNEEKWQNIQRKMTGYIVDVKLPRFKTDADIQLIPVMKELGMQSAFDSNLADFRNLASASNTYLSEMKQKSAIELDEKGTKAAVVTMEIVTVGYAGKRDKIKHRDFHATRPFAYIISEVSTGTIIFVGTYYGE